MICEHDYLQVVNDCPGYDIKLPHNKTPLTPGHESKLSIQFPGSWVNWLNQQTVNLPSSMTSRFES
nr:MAG TPA: protein of Unknown Function (DUF1543) [Caudoviricetes sp.]